jgi:hypothetical protein
MGFLLNKLASEWPLIASAPVAFALAVAGSAIILGLAIWAVLHFAFKTRSANLKSALDTKDAHIRLLERELDIERSARNSAMEANSEDDFMPVVGMILQSSEPAVRETFASLRRGGKLELADDPRESPERWQQREEADLKLAAVVRHLADIGAATIERRGDRYVVLATTLGKSGVVSSAADTARRTPRREG